ncbi:GAF domain-containing protein [Allocoleopsis franciscana]|uniref:Methyl-accepting chemotaxis protein n=1 Tax=Allocoleopsis franciscana PCC 7113 TaxID=1173027 RepID=K9WE01_9CYAN|nr:GAF domain-containing protein [Allocoleopsis franciscana]AFZ17757.1 methyl-accepting chemotaxis protein [Allocoleopsis franciscana PCC 7113]
MEGTPKRSFLRTLHLASLSTARWLRQLRSSFSSKPLIPEKPLESLPRLPPALAPDHELESLSRLPPALAPDHELESLSRLPPALPPINWYPERYLSQSPTLVPVPSNGNFSVPLPLRTALVRDLLCTSMATFSKNQFLLPGGQPNNGTGNTLIETTPDDPGMPYPSCSDLTGHPDEESTEEEESSPSHSEADDPSLPSPHPVSAPLCLPEVSVSDGDTSSDFHLDTALPENTDLRDEFTQPDLETTKTLTMHTIDPSEHILNPEPQHKLSQSHVNGDWASTGAKGNLPLSLDMEEYLKRERQWLLNLAERMRQASTFDTINTLLEITITEVRDHLKLDRVLIYRFQSETHGVVMAESLLTGYTPSSGAFLPALIFGGNNQKEFYQQQAVTLSPRDSSTTTPYQIQLLKRYQIEASLSLPIIIDKRVWGLLVVQQCSTSRPWQEAEINLLYQIVTEITLHLQLGEVRNQKQRKIELEKAIGKVSAKILKNILRSLDVATVFSSATKEIRQQLQCDRVAVYRFLPDWSGEFIAESVGPDWVPLVGPNIQKIWADTYLQETEGGRYRHEETTAVDNIYTSGVTQCHIELLEQFEAKAYLIAPIFEGEKLWGLLAAFQNSGARHWEDAEISMLALIGRQFGVALQQAEYLEKLQTRTGQLSKIAEQERSAARVIDKIRQTTDIDTIFKTTTLEVRKFLDVERVTIYKFRENYFGDFVTESESGGWPKLVGSGWEDPYLHENRGGRFRNNEPLVVDDVYHAGLTECHVEALEEFGVKSCLVVAIFQGSKLWGLLSAFQNSGTRHWQESEVKLMMQIADHLGVALQQAEYLRQVKAQTEWQAKEAQREQALAKVIDKIRQSLDIDAIFTTTTQEVRKLLNVERVTIYKFREDYFGDFVTESESGGWPKLVGSGWEDPYLSEHQGGRFRNNEALVVDDVYNGGLTDCHVEALEDFGVKSCLVVAIFQGSKLWGLLSAFQNSGSRHWEENEVKLMMQVSGHLGVALQQADYLKQVQAQNEQLAKETQRERALARVIDKIRQTLDIKTVFKTAAQEMRILLGVDRVTIYKFRDDYFGDFVFESEFGGWPTLVGSGWEDSYIQEHQGGRFRNNEPLVVDDVYNGGLSQCHVDVLDDFGIKSCLVVSLFQGQKLWGLLSAFQHTGPKHWDESEVKLLMQVSAQLGVALQQSEYLTQLEEQSRQISKTAELEQATNKIVSKIRQSLEIEQIFRTTCTEIRQHLKADRVGVFRFHPDSGFNSGELVSEDVGAGYTPAMSIEVEDHCFGEKHAENYRKGRIWAVTDIYKANLADCYISTLSQFQVRANLVVPLMQGTELLGLLCVHQCSGPRHWHKDEMQFAKQIALQCGMALEQVQYLKKVEEQSTQLATMADTQKVVAKILTRLSQSQDLDSIYRTTNREARQLLKCDRVAVYRFDPDWSGRFVAESVAKGWVQLVGPEDIQTVWPDTYLQETQGGRYRNRETFVVDDIYTIGHSECHLEILEQFEVKAYVLAPIFVADKLWGILGAYQNTGPRQWNNAEVTALTQIGQGVGTALQRVNYLEQLEQQSNKYAKLAERETNFINLLYKTGQRIAEHLQQGTLNPNTLLRATAQELRLLLKADRVAVYRFHPNWSGEFVIEDVGGSYMRLVGSEWAQVTDSLLKETKGGIYRKNEVSVVNDITDSNSLTFEQQALEQWGVKSYAIAPLFNGDQLWGLLAVYQNSELRTWEEGEVKLLVQMATQLGIALQQAESLDQIQHQSQQLAEAAQREKADKEALQHEVLQLLSAVRPALEGNLTVRAPVTESEVGTVADAYNNTLQSLRAIVQQVQDSSRKVAQTSQESDVALTSLTEQAQKQFQALEQALDQIQTMVEFTQGVGNSAQQVEASVQQANQIVRTGDEAMNRTVDGILAIRETVAETSKRIKRLSESSQKVSRVVNLISNFTTQTQLLALNASIEATRAGEYGRGFVVVADEVRTLARQSAEAATEIEQLVQEIQKGTAEVSTVMETGIQQVAQGTNLVTDARQNLNAIIEATSRISQLVDGITNATQLQTQEFQSVTKTMTEVATIANKTSEDSKDISSSFKELLTMAQNLQRHADQFKAN